MSEFQEFSQTGTTETPRWVGLAVGILGGLSLVGLGLSWSALNQAKSLEQTAVASKQASDALTQRLAKEDEINQQMQRSEEHTSELQSRLHLVCRLLLEKKKNIPPQPQVTS